MPPITPTQLWYRDELEGMLTEGDPPDEELSNCGGALDKRQTDRLNVKLEEYSRDARVGADLPFVVGDAVLICM